MNYLPEKEIKFVAVYARVSSSKQEEENTIDVQLLEIKKFTDDHGYIVLQEYCDEGWSGDVLARPKLDQLRQEARNKSWDAVVIYDPDRLARRSAWQEIVIEELKELGIDVLFTTIPKPKNDEDVIMYRMRGVFAEYERMKIAERFRLGKVNRIANGHILTSEAPYGYTYIPNMGKKGSADYVPGHLEENDLEKKVLKAIFQMVGDEGFTLRGVVKELQRLGIPPRKSKRGVWNTSTLTTMLRNKVYIGKAHWGASYAVVPTNPLKNERYKKVKKSSRRIKPEKEWKWVDVPPLIENALFEQTGNRLRKNFETLGRNKVNNYLLAGRVFCNCGGRRAGEGAQKGKYLYYRCENRVYTFPFPATCKEAGIDAKIADKAVWEAIEKLISSPELLREQIERWQKNSHNTIKRKSVIDIDSAKKEIAKLNSQSDRYADAYSKGIFSLDKLEGYTSAIKVKIHEFEEQIRVARAEEAASPKQFLLPGQNEIDAFVREVIAHVNNLNFKVKQAIVRRIVEKVITSREELQVYGYIQLNHVGFFSECRNRWFAKRGEVHAL